MLLWTKTSYSAIERKKIECDDKKKKLTQNTPHTQYYTQMVFPEWSVLHQYWVIAVYKVLSFVATGSSLHHRSAKQWWYGPIFHSWVSVNGQLLCGIAVNIVCATLSHQQVGDGSVMGVASSRILTAFSHSVVNRGSIAGLQMLVCRALLHRVAHSTCPDVLLRLLVSPPGSWYHARW